MENGLSRPRQAKYFNQERILIQEITGGNPPRISATYCNEQLYALTRELFLV